MRAMRPGRGLGWMAGAVGLLVAGRLWRRRTGASLPEPAPSMAPEPEPAWPPDDEASSQTTPFAGWDLTQEDADTPREEAGAPGPGLPPRVRRGPSGREHFWLEP
ncbi:hypothetical protein JYK02_25975 [Corallococcus macrosporus]|uniref:Uncharacterized protein n=1 Tax=Corallococcus macrosporus TaxID=35 RepID=A0ABS3DI07_9BACT|nr:hypothetical protein [Corallococcus macrosporus]MBN8230971.1 hypothetical protein [Corallococcus macrosporus]